MHFFSNTVVYLLLGVLSGDFQHKNHSLDVALAPHRLPVIRVVLSYQQILSNIRSRVFRTSSRSQDTFC